ncbi:MAG: hypothetical protein M1818_003058 [Claussenomyces sp. TS43310]|nr:MAG: hypothetical protein M1818_003058 [Claussenomyces sp. TS43310]
MHQALRRLAKVFGWKPKSSEHDAEIKNAKAREGTESVSVHAETPARPEDQPAQQATPREDYGLFSLYTPPNPESCNVDIVAVHGLGGDWEKTWTDTSGPKERLWLRDFLPARFPDARVMSFGYDSTFALSSSVMDITAAAASLLDYLDGARFNDHEKRRPIIFIAHSLGGIVVKRVSSTHELYLSYLSKGVIDQIQVLILANERSDHYRDILESAEGAVFFAVPHRGANLAYWAKFATNIMSFATLGARGNPNFVKALKRNSPEFANISQAFVQPASKFLIIRSFYEAVKIGNELIVDRDSATLGIPNELAMQIPGADHRNICKFSGADTQKYKIVQDALQKIFAKIEKCNVASTNISGKKIEDLVRTHGDSARCEWQMHIKDSAPTGDDLTWVLRMTQYCSWVSGKGSRLMCIEYEHPWIWQATLTSVIERDLQGKGVNLVWFLNTLPSAQQHRKEESSVSSAEEGLLLSLPRTLVSQIFSKEPEILAKVDDIQNEMQKTPIDTWQSPRLSGSEYAIVLVGCNQQTYEVLQQGLEYLAPVFLEDLLYDSQLSSISHNMVDMKVLECLSSLYFPELHARRNRIGRSERGTNEWIWEHPIYASWQEANSSLLWIHGKPGSGKSNLAASLQKLLPTSEDGRHHLIADFFYSSRGGSIETSHRLMLRSVLYQLLRQQHSLFPMFQQSFQRLRTKFSGEIVWPYRELRKILLNLAMPERDKTHRMNLRHHKILLLLDGLDESESKMVEGPERSSLLSLLSKLCSIKSPNIFKVIALSRAEPDIRGALKTPHIIDIKDVNEVDIRQIVRVGMARLWRHITSDEDDQIIVTDRLILGRIEAFCDSGGSSENDDTDTFTSQGFRSTDGDNTHLPPKVIPEIPELDHVSDYLLQHAGGVILWVVMIIRELIKVAKLRAFTLAQLNSTLSTIPTSLNDLYRDIIGTIENSPLRDQRQSSYIFTWIMFAGRTLRMNEARDAIALSHRAASTGAGGTFLYENRISQMTKSWTPTRTFLMNLCGGLVETVPSLRVLTRDMTIRHLPAPEWDYVQLIHQTAKEFLLFDPDADFLHLNKSSSLELVCDACIDYLVMTFPVGTGKTVTIKSEEDPALWTAADVEALGRLVEDRPLLEYIFHQLPIHLKDQEWEESSRRKAYIKLSGYLRSIECKVQSPACILLGRWSQTHGLLCPELNDMVNYSGPPSLPELFNQLCKGRPADGSNDAKEEEAELRSEERALMPFRCMALVFECIKFAYDHDHVVAYQNFHWFSKDIRDLTTIANACFGEIGGALVCRAAHRGNHIIVGLLLKCGALANQPDEQGDTALHLAVRGGCTLVVKELLKSGQVSCHGVSPADGMTPMTTADLLSPNHPIRSLLLEYDDASNYRFSNTKSIEQPDTWLRYVYAEPESSYSIPAT